MILKNKNIVIYGAGISGMSALGLVHSLGGHAIVYDDADTPNSTSNKSVFNNAEIIILSPGVSNNQDFLLDAKLENKTVISELDFASKICNAEQIAITGTNGKTTTTMLVNHILNQAGVSSVAVGNIGHAFSSVADRLDATETAVVEVSSFQLENMHNFSPDIAVLLNIGSDHLDRHKTHQKYAEIKSRIFADQSEQDWIVYNYDDPAVRQFEHKMVGHKVPFSTKQPVHGAYISSGFVCYAGKPIVEVNDIDFAGDELQNVLASVAVGMIKGINPFTIASAIQSFSRPEFRRQKTAKVNNITFVNDSKSTNISACKTAIDCFDSMILMLGGSKNQDNFDDLFSVVDTAKIKALVISGENQKEIFESAKTFGMNNIFVENDFEKAVELCFFWAQKLDAGTVLFSPASKSFDKFKNFKERGQKFNKIVGALK